MGKRRVIVACALIAGALLWVAISGLRNSLVYYRTPTEVLNMGRTAYGEPIRLGGYVLPGSVRHTGRGRVFVVSDGTTRLTVVATGDVPPLFRPGQGVGLGGDESPDGRVRAGPVVV